MHVGDVIVNHNRFMNLETAENTVSGAERDMIARYKSHPKDYERVLKIYQDARRVVEGSLLRKMAPAAAAYSQEED